MEEDADSRRWAELAVGLSSGEEDGENTGYIGPINTTDNTVTYNLAHDLPSSLQVKARPEQVKSYSASPMQLPASPTQPWCTGIELPSVALGALFGAARRAQSSGGTGLLAGRYLLPDL